MCECVCVCVCVCVWACVCGCVGVCVRAWYSAIFSGIRILYRLCVNETSLSEFKVLLPVLYRIHNSLRTRESCYRHSQRAKVN